MAAAYPELLVPYQVAPPEPAAEPDLLAPALPSSASIRVQSFSSMTRSQARMYTCLGLIWVAANILFWCWWLQPSHVGAVWLYVLMTAALAYDATVLPTAFLFFVGRMRHPRPFIAEPGL